ncbi:hypothetical protein OH77DRAFT_267383 [Trametes cingulata]|nr:hypothetical protein OH77DRAFT_267383 [Trametes cingulata]
MPPVFLLIATHEYSSAPHTTALPATARWSCELLTPGKLDECCFLSLWLSCLEDAVVREQDYSGLLQPPSAPKSLTDDAPPPCRLVFCQHDFAIHGSQPLESGVESGQALSEYVKEQSMTPRAAPLSGLQGGCGLDAISRYEQKSFMVRNVIVD